MNINGLQIEKRENAIVVEGQARFSAEETLALAALLASLAREDRVEQRRRVLQAREEGED